MTEPESSGTDSIEGIGGIDADPNPQEPDLQVAYTESDTRASKEASAQAVENSFASDVAAPYKLRSDAEPDDSGS